MSARTNALVSKNYCVYHSLLCPVANRRELLINAYAGWLEAAASTKVSAQLEHSSRWSVLGKQIHFFRRVTMKNFFAIALLSTALVSGAAYAQLLSRPIALHQPRPLLPQVPKR